MTGSRACLAITALGLALRVAYALSVPNQFTDWTDSRNYLSIARHLADSLHYSNSYQPSGEPPVGVSGPTAFREPLYPLFLAAELRCFGESPRLVFLGQSVLGAATVPLVWAIAREALGPEAAIAAALLQSVHPYQIFYGANLSTETLVSLLLLLLAWAALRLLSRLERGAPPWSAALLLGVVSGAAILGRAALALVALVAVKWVSVTALRRRRPLGHVIAVAGLASAVAILVVSPWLARNAALWHRPVFVTNAGENLVIGYNDFARGGYERTRVFEIDAEISKLPYDEAQRDSVFRSRAFAWARAHPARAAGLFAIKLARFWNPVPEVHGARRLIGTAWTAAFLALALVGIARARRMSARAWIVLALLLAYAVAYALAFVITRFRVPVEALVAVWAGSGLVALLGAKRAKPGEAE